MKAKTLKAMSDHALAEYPRESCGLVLRQGTKEKYWPCLNSAASPSQHFSISPEEYAQAEDAGEVVAVVHSHPDVSVMPSEGDLASCEATGLEWVIVRVDLDIMTNQVSVIETYSWRPNGWQAPLVGRSFHYGTLDCWSLVRDWYREELGEELCDFHRGHDNWWNDMDSDFSPYESQANYDKAGLEKVTDGTLLRGDMIFMQVRSRAGKPNHVGVLVDDQHGIMLHHLYGALSDRVIYGGYWQETTRFVLRKKKAPK